MLRPYKFKNGLLDGLDGLIALIDESQVIGVVYGPYERVTCTKCFTWKPARTMWCCSTKLTEIPAAWVVNPIANEGRAIQLTEISWLEVLIVTGMSRERSEQALEPLWDVFVHNNSSNE